MGRQLESEEDREPWFEASATRGKVAVFDVKGTVKSTIYTSVLSFMRQLNPAVLSLSQVIAYPSLFADYPASSRTTDWNPMISLRFSFSKLAVREKKLHLKEGTKFARLGVKVNQAVVVIFLTLMVICFPKRRIEATNTDDLSVQERFKEIEEVVFPQPQVPKQSMNGVLLKVVSLLHWGRKRPHRQL